MKFGVMASGQYTEPVPSGADLRRIAEAIDSLPFDSLWVSDHISFKNPILEGMVALTAFAAWTTRVKVGTGVLLLPLRSPSLVAKQVASADVIAGGRVVLGIGVGGEGDRDFASVQVPVHQRGGRTDEGLDVLRKLWTGRSVNHHGEYFAFDEVVIDPPPRQQPLPIWVGGRAPAALRRAGRVGSAWLAYMVSSERFARSLTTARDAAEQCGRPREVVSGAMMLPTCIHDDRRIARRTLIEHLSQRYGRPIEGHVVDRYCAAGTVDDCRARIEEYGAAGTDHVVLMPSSPMSQREEEIRAFAEALLPEGRSHA